ncbi:MAG: Na+/H+ antiporter NhaC family protein [Dysosmobacter sp.]
MTGARFPCQLAYILDSTSSPVCILVPITGWGVYIMGIIATEFENLGIQTSDASAFVQAIPYQFYALLALVLVPLIALSKRDFGPMAKFEAYVLENGPTTAELEADKSIVQSENASKATAWEMIIPCW